MFVFAEIFTKIFFFRRNFRVTKRPGTVPIVSRKLKIFSQISPRKRKYFRMCTLRLYRYVWFLYAKNQSTKISCYGRYCPFEEKNATLIVVFLGVLSEWGQMSTGRLQRPVGFHAGRDQYHPPGTYPCALLFCIGTVGRYLYGIG